MSLLLSCQNILIQFINIIYPPRCHICQDFLKDNGQEKDLICQYCLDDFPEITSPVCPVCGKTFESISAEDHWCEACLRKPPFYDTLSAPYAYEDGIMEAIHLFKYGGKIHLAKSLGPLLAEFALERIGIDENLLMMPVPLHPKKLRQRGFNQSLLLARAVKPFLKTELDFLSLRRIRYTQPQTGLKNKERRKNIKGAFQIKNGRSFKGRSVLLVDDVATTTSTLDECARVLKKAGCDKVFCLVLARALG